MNSYNPVGGYFELELRKDELLHSDSVLLNSARNCLEYILMAGHISKVYIPKFICDVMLQPLEKLSIDYEFYKLNETLELAEELNLKASERLLYVNYFGVKDDYCDKLTEKYGDSLVIDASQAFYYQRKGKHIIYSPRKFFGVPDGGMLYTDKKLEGNFQKDISYNRTSHLLKRIDLGAEKAYPDFITNDKTLNNQPIKWMSNLTKKLLSNIDYEGVRQRRLKNFAILNKELGNLNSAEFDQEQACPMVYPFFVEDASIRRKLIDRKVYIATYWPNIFEWCKPDEVEYKLAQQLLPLPIDQRYGEEEMLRMLELINEYIH